MCTYIVTSVYVYISILASVLEYIHIHTSTCSVKTVLPGCKDRDQKKRLQGEVEDDADAKQDLVCEASMVEAWSSEGPQDPTIDPMVSNWESF